MARVDGQLHMGEASGLPRTCEGLFTHITQAPDLDGTGPKEREVVHAAIPGLVVDLRMLPGCARGIAIGKLTGGRHITDANTSAGGPQHAQPGSPPEALQISTSRALRSSAAGKLGSPEAAGPMSKEVNLYGSRVLAPELDVGTPPAPGRAWG